MPAGALPRACFLLSWLLSVAAAQQTVVLSSTDSSIIYNPPLCTPASIAAGCASPWQISNNTIPEVTVVYTNGPISQAGDVIPQVFLNFRASTLYLRTTSFSNATINFTLTAEPSDASITSEINTPIGFILAENISETQTTTLGITFLPGDSPTRFDIQSITLTVMNASATQCYLPSASLPRSSSPPIFVPTHSASATHVVASSLTSVITSAVMGVILSAFSSFMLVFPII